MIFLLYWFENSDNIKENSPQPTPKSHIKTKTQLWFVDIFKLNEFSTFKVSKTLKVENSRTIANCFRLIGEENAFLNFPTSVLWYWITNVVVFLDTQQRLFFGFLK